MEYFSIVQKLLKLQLKLSIFMGNSYGTFVYCDILFHCHFTNRDINNHDKCNGLCYLIFDI